MTQNQDNHIAGAGYIAISVFFIAVASALAKWLGETYHPIELVFYRNVIVLLALSIFISANDNWGVIKTNRIKSHIGRGTVGTIGIILGFAAVHALPLADATILMFTSTLFVVLLSYPLLKEKVGPYKISAVIIGFIGVLLVSKPSGEFIFIGVLLALGAAFFNALVEIYLRELGKTENPITTVFYFMFWGMIITGLALPFVWTGPKMADLLLIFGLGAAGGLQQLLKTKGHSIAPVALTAPITYTALIWATLFGFLFWNTLPTWSVVLGAIIIIGSNALVIWREQTKKHYD